MNGRFLGQIRKTGFPLLTAIIWGTVFVAQSLGAQHVEAMTFTAARAFVGGVVLLPVVLALRLRRRRKEACKQQGSVWQLFKASLACGAMLALASNLQQYGISYTSVGKAGFITTLYILFVPLAGVFLGRRPHPVVWPCLAAATAGLYLLCINGALSLGVGDLFMLLCAAAFAVQILVVDRFASNVDPLELSCAQFFAIAVMSGIGMLLFERPSWQGLLDSLWPVLYVGIVSSGIADTLQIVAQKDNDPTLVSLLLSLESVFALLAGFFFFGESMGAREVAGCALMLLAVVVSQLPELKKTLTPKQKP